jgi:hypothetical protein
MNETVQKAVILLMDEYNSPQVALDAFLEVLQQWAKHHQQDESLDYLVGQQRLYFALISDVEKLSPEAADYMRSLPKSGVDVTYSGLLSQCFVWNETPQGVAFWSKLNTQLMRGRHEF